MKKFISPLLLLGILLGACSPGDNNAQATPGESLPTEAGQVPAKREALIVEFTGDVKFAATSAESPVAAVAGAKILETGSLITGDDGRTKLSLTPEGTILRVGPNSILTVPVLGEENGEPKSTIELAAGKVHVMLKGGALDVQTPSGVASVRGSLLGVQYDPEKKRIVATCLEGDCNLESASKTEYALPAGYQSFTNEDGEFVDPFEMDRDEIEEWLEYSDELDDYLDELPNPEDYEDIDIDSDDFYAWLEDHGWDDASCEAGSDDCIQSSGDDPTPDDSGGDSSSSSDDSSGGD